MLPPIACPFPRLLPSTLEQQTLPPVAAAMEPTTIDTTKMERRSSASVKRRVSRACDHCHRMRTRCNGTYLRQVAREFAH
jgi:hypothetical protein